MALNGPFLNVPAIFNVFLDFGTMCLLDSLVDIAICGGLVLAKEDLVPQWHHLNIGCAVYNQTLGEATSNRGPIPIPIPIGQMPQKVIARINNNLDQVRTGPQDI